MAVGAIAQCLKQYDRDTLVTALQCVTETRNNKPGMLSAKMIKALCDALHQQPQWRNAGLRLFDAFDHIDLEHIQQSSSIESAVKGIGRVQAIADKLHAEFEGLFQSTT